MEMIIAITIAVIGSSGLTALITGLLNRRKTTADTRQVLVDTDRAWIETVDRVRDFVLEEVVRLQHELKSAREESALLREQLMAARQEIARLSRDLIDAEARIGAM